MILVIQVLYTRSDYNTIIIRTIKMYSVIDECVFRPLKRCISFALFLFVEIGCIYTHMLSYVKRAKRKE